MNSATYKKMRSKAIAYARKRGSNRESAEDFAQDWIIKKELKGKMQKIAFAYIDHVRCEIGRFHDKRSYELNDSMLGSYRHDESFLIDLNPEKLKKTFGHDKYFLFQMMIQGIGFVEKCNILNLSNCSVHRKQTKIKEHINETLNLNLSVNRTNRPC